MTLFKCNRCGRSCYDLYRINLNEFYRSEGYYQPYGATYSAINLCRACFDELKDFLNAYGKEVRDQLKNDTKKKKLYECTCCGRMSNEVIFYKAHDTFLNCILPKRKRRCNIIICDSCYSHLTHINHIVHKYGCFDVLENAIKDHLIEEEIYKK